MSTFVSSTLQIWRHEHSRHFNIVIYVGLCNLPFYAINMDALWDSLSERIQTLGRSKVCVCGDFNAVRSSKECHSGRGRTWSLDHVSFNRFIDDNNLIDLPLSGRKFTWFKGDGVSMSRLDRFLLSGEWCLSWPNCSQIARMRGLSDHCPLILVANEEDWGPRPSRMLKCWKDVPGYNIFVKEKWNSYQVDGWGGFVLKEKGVRMTFLRRKSLSFMGLLRTYTLSRLNASICWQQSRSRWLKEGDANSKYFHSVLANRRRGNAISSLQVGGVTVEGVAPIRQAVVSHFASHFQAVTVDRPGVDSLTFKPLLPTEVGSLIRPFSLEEIKAAVSDCDSYKSPGPDGINFGFIKDFRTEMQGDGMRFIAEFHRNGRLTKGINATFIALIPKVESPQRLNEFRPISLVGSLYKILAKVLLNRLRLVMGSVISESQTAFVRDRQILYGILIANEVVDEARRLRRSCYFLRSILRRSMTLWTGVTWMLLWGEWVSLPSRGNGLRNESARPPRRSYSMESRLTNSLSRGAFGKGIPYPLSFSCKDVPISVSHLQFVDDTLLLGTKSWANGRALRAVLVLFVAMSGLKVNFNKSMLVGVNIPESWLGEAASALGCRVGNIPFLYLGLPIGGDPRCLSFWEPVLSRVKKRLSGWKTRFLSYGGRLVLLKSVLTSLSVYALSFFKAPSARYGVERGRLCVGGMRGSSWWREIARIRDGGGEAEGGWFGGHIWRQMTCSSWGRGRRIGLGVAASVEGVGGGAVGGSREFNLALLGKWCWRMLVDREGLWFRVLASRYGVERGRLCVGGMRGSSWWREIARIRDGGGEAEGVWFGGHIWRQAHSFDRWLWQPDPGCGYSVRGAYQILTAQAVAPLDAASGLIWHPQIPLKVTILAWRLLRDRLPTKVNMFYRGILSEGDSHCVTGCGVVESAQHVFISCSSFGSLWTLISSWVGSAPVLAQTLPDHFVQFSSSAGGSRSRRSVMQFIWLACVWVVWTERNHRCFTGSAIAPLHLMDKIKTFSFRWLTAKSCTLAINYHSWWSSPMLCLGLV
ncbi:hypothetical protein TSUD_274870 [Trifolium subterraneum]|uniref:Reverse transcriptase domain-containing protein n=1 Tax=Trifolium subterraneum TaxID=3900 RepID=A0A2Z6NH89_TRISU|nr:hypothetical protein TSUD_274870 [Trifolium subterraneum]